MSHVKITETKGRTERGNDTVVEQTLVNGIPNKLVVSVVFWREYPGGVTAPVKLVHEHDARVLSVLVDQFYALSSRGRVAIDRDDYVQAVTDGVLPDGV